MNGRRLSIALFACVLFYTTARAEPLRYAWKPETHVVYDVNIVADEPTTKTTFTGLIEYTVAADGKLKYKGGLKKTVTKKPNHPDNQRRSRGPFGGPFGRGGFGPPRVPSPFTRRINPFKGTEQTTNDLELDEQGHLISIKGSSQLPFMIGHLSVLPFESLPEGDETSWEEQVGIVLSEAKEKIVSTRPFGGPPSPFAPRSSNEPEKRTAGGEWTKYKVVKDQDGMVEIEKTSVLQPASKEDGKSLRIDGSGTWIFNRNLQLPESLEFSQNIVITGEGQKLTIPVAIRYDRLTDEELAKIAADRLAAEEKRQAEEMQRKQAAERKAAEAKRIAEAPLTPDELTATLTELKSASAVELVNRLKKLAAKSPSDPEQEVVAALQPLVSHSNQDVRLHAQQALAKYSPEYKKEYDLLSSYRKGGAVPQPSFLVPADVKLPQGLIIVYQDTRDKKWYPGKVTGEADDGNITFKLVRWPHWDGKRLRTSLRLPDRKADQPNVDAATVAQLYGGQPSRELIRVGMRFWSDKTGGFRVEAKYLKIENNVVYLELKNGKQAKVPTDKLSEEDQEYVQLLQQKPKQTAVNPFEILD